MERGAIICGKVICPSNINPSELYHVIRMLESICNPIVEASCSMKCCIYNGNYIKIFIRGNAIHLVIPLILYLKSFLLSKYKMDIKFAIGIGEIHLFDENLNYANGNAFDLAFIDDEDLIIRSPIYSKTIDIDSLHLKEFIENNKIEI